MNKRIIALAVLFSALSAQASSTFNPATSGTKIGFINTYHTSKPECTFTASVSLNIIGQSASITCSSSQPSCDVAINDVTRCIKLAKTKLQYALGL